RDSSLDGNIVHIRHRWFTWDSGGICPSALLIVAADLHRRAEEWRPIHSRCTAIETTAGDAPTA
ncbi:MAG: hypothetical protein WAL41_04160, partial [Mycobacterium sp.]